ncbi:MAG: SGNH/GDSL hydrolase family protein [Deltaproteobacteria bacterium]|nr:SGNH/GDSL hydrolase family protein [Deltaproteobacteria bacterium]MBW2360878.1 SGNH/GDSL hydrolase family protein [Deltaproteobacteria bacterium]
MQAQVHREVTVAGAAVTLLVGIQVLFVGDSITAGTGADPGQGFVDLMASANPDRSVHNAGCGGSTTRDWVLPKLPGAPEHCAFGGAFEQLAAPHVDADLVHILLGTNDSTGFFEPGSVGPDEYASNIEALAVRFTGDVVVSIPTPFPDPDDIVQSRLDLFALELISLSESADAPFRLGADFSRMDRAMLDGVHPTNEGHAWMAAQLSSVLVPEPASAMLLLMGLLALSARRPRARAMRGGLTASARGA